MYESPQPESDEQEAKKGWWARSWKACLLVMVMLLGLLGTPLAILYQLNANRAPQQPAIIEDDTGAIDRIVYVTTDHQVATIAPDGSGGKLLTNQRQRFEFPAWSPDGSLVATIGGDRVYVLQDVDESQSNENLAAIYDNAEQSPFYLYWSPDSTQVSFLTNHPEGIALHLAGTGGGKANERLLAIGQPFYWDWTPGGEQILIHAGLSGADARLALLDIVGSGGEEEIAQPGSFQAPGYSVSGRFRAFAGLDVDGNSELVVQDEDGSTTLAEPHLGQMAMSWSPSKDQLAFTSPSLGAFASNGPIRLFDPLTGKIRTLVQENVLAFFWSPNGQVIAYLTLPGSNDGNIQVSYRPNQDRFESPKRIQEGQGSIDLWVVNVESGYQRRLSFHVPSPTFAHQFLPFFDQYALSHSLWSPTSDALVIPMIEDGDSLIVIVSALDGSQQTLASGEIGFWSYQ